jgi:hypothetical protein
MSRVRAEALDLENVDYGVVSKDLSQATISNVTIKTARIAGLAAYIKKPSYGPASIVAEGVTFSDIPADHQTLVQTGSWIDLEGTRIWGIDFDVDACTRNGQSEHALPQPEFRRASIPGTAFTLTAFACCACGMCAAAAPDRGDLGGGLCGFGLSRLPGRS